MPIHLKDSALNAALRLDYTGPATPRPDGDLGVTVLECLAAAPQPLAACVAVFDVARIDAGTYCLDPAGFLHRVHPQPPPLAHPRAELAILLGGPATISPADFRAYGVAAGIVSQRLVTRLGMTFRQVACDDETVAWPLTTANSRMIHLTTVTARNSDD
jgi:hypothetical protein